jgi:putative phosphoribosyl transferase
VNLSSRTVEISADGVSLPGELVLPPDPSALVVFAHGSGSSRRSPRNVAVAERLHRDGLGTLLFDLLTEPESTDRRLVFDIGLLAVRLALAVGVVTEDAAASGLPIGLFGASTGAAAALVASVTVPQVGAIVSRGGRPDLAGDALVQVTAPTLLIVGGKDREVLELNREAQARLRSRTRLEIVPGATHLFEEPGGLGRVAELASGWFVRHLGPGGAARPVA